MPMDHFGFGAVHAREFLLWQIGYNFISKSPRFSEGLFSCGDEQDMLEYFTMTERKTISLIPAGTEKRATLDFKSGDTVKVFQKIQEKGKTRLQAFEGLVLARKHGKEQGATFTVRKVASGVGVERVFPLYSPAIDRIEVVKHAKTRRAKLYYIREKVAKEARKKLKHVLLGKVKEEEAENSPEVSQEQTMVSE